EETLIKRPDARVNAVIYDIGGNTASSVNFFATDSVAHFVSGALYFNTQPNIDSLQPAVEFFRKDIIHLINTLHWK
ncbi:MAG: gliding motility protein GldD, partial [Bacteroidales bacterium]|nr:gliding motility protein GldD [Bacteroidales bacterium]